MTDTVVVEGQVRLREGKKWKTRWVVLRKPSPVADCLCVLVYKERSKGQREKSQLTLGDICGLELLQSYEGVNFALTLLCLTQSVTLGFDSRENLLAWDTRIRYSLGEVHRFSVNIQPGTKLESGAASLHLCNNLLVIARDIPPAVIAHWRLTDLRRYGAVPNGFIFEGGTRCGYWTGVFFLACADGEQISFLFDCIARGSSPRRTSLGLRPSLSDLSAHASSVEERITQEASELEKRLSMLSVCSRQSSTGDARSISSSSSDTSHSDASLSSRLATWAEPVRYPTPIEPSVSVSGAMGSRPSSEEHHEGLLRPPTKPPCPRGLQEAGRQSSTDSGIATGSHSSYSGSFSSYTGSLDTAQGEIEEFGSVMSLTLNTNSSTNLTANPNTPTSTSTSNTNPRLPPQFQTASILASPAPLSPGYRLCVCPIAGVSEVQELEYQVPAQLLQHYDTPRRFIQPHPSTSSSTQKPECGLSEPLGSTVFSKMTATASVSGDGFLPPGGLTMQRHVLCPVCGGIKMAMPIPHTRSSHVPAALEKTRPELSSHATAPPEGMSVGPFTEAEQFSRYELLSGQVQQKCFLETEGRSSAVPTSPMISLRLFRHSSLSGRSSALSGDSGSTVTDRLQGESVNYVNIPVSPMSKRQLNYMELDLLDVQETGHTIRGASNTKYAQIDHAATETAQRVGAQHAQGREERLHELEQRRRGTLN
ncbi:protein Dok-7 isoform X1 [Silurus asotus]|uniref:Protein Dok-7 isoform X1 n=1 Tax=Silurus asotus TaxID=30991 RepID=A0AAD5AJW7_SILAS|nr:protein Dok-7 isoform X1 [Silurus asotus]